MEPITKSQFVQQFTFLGVVFIPNQKHPSLFFPNKVGIGFEPVAVLSFRGGGTNVQDSVPVEQVATRQLASRRGECCLAHSPILASIQLPNGAWFGVGARWSAAGDGEPKEGAALLLLCPWAVCNGTLWKWTVLPYLTIV